MLFYTIHFGVSYRYAKLLWTHHFPTDHISTDLLLSCILFCSLLLSVPPLDSLRSSSKLFSPYLQVHPFFQPVFNDSAAPISSANSLKTVLTKHFLVNSPPHLTTFVTVTQFYQLSHNFLFTCLV